MPRVKVCFAQALDNSAPDHIVWDGQTLPVQSERERSLACTLVSSVSMAGEKLYEMEGVRLFLAGPLFVLEVMPQERDVANRAAPIAICIERDDDDTAMTIVDVVQSFAESIGRTITVDRMNSVKIALDTLAKKKRPRGCLLPFL